MSEAEAAQELEKAKALPFAERVKHAKWKVRNEAWLEVTQEVSSSSEGETACDDKKKKWCGESSDLFAAGVSDTNSAAQATALEALTSTLQKVAESKEDAIVSINGTAICKGLGSKCLSSRPNIVKRAKEAFLLFVELGRGDLVTQALISHALSHKVSKVALNAVEVLTEGLKTYGTKALDPKPLLREMPKLFDAKDAKVRSAAKELTAELCRWIEPNVIRELLLNDVREATKKDIELLICQNEGQTVAPLKPLRNEELPKADQQEGGQQQTSVNSGGQSDTSERNENANANAEKLDSFALSEPVDILSDLDEFWNGVKEQKWSTRRNALLSLKEKASAPKIESGDFMPVAKELKRIITLDSNVSCVNAAIDCICALARGLRKSFKPAAKLLCSCLLDKFKDKSAAVTRSIHQALSSCFEFCFSLLDAQDEIVKYIKHKNPKNRLETINLCTKVLQFPQEMSAASKVHESILKESANAATDSSPAVRDSALLLVVQFAKIAGSLSAIESYTSSIDSSRMSKIQAAMNENNKENKEGTKKKPGASKALSSTSSKAKPQVSKEKQKEKTASATATKRKSISSSHESRTTRLDNVVDDFKDLIGDETFQGLKSSLWKDRLQSVKDIRDKAKEICLESERNLDIMVAALCQIPGWGDSNFQVLLNVFEIFADLIESKAKISNQNVEFITTGCVEKIADVKLNAKICELMDAFINLIGVERLVMKVLNKSASHKNPKVLLESLEWTLTNLTKETAARKVDPKALIEAVKVNLGNSNPSIRLAATNILATLIAYRGMENKSHLGEVKPTVMAKIDSTVSDLRDKGIVPVSPTKTPKKRIIPKKEPEEDDDSSPNSDESNLQLPGGLLGKLSDSNWKVRRGALEELLEIAKNSQEMVKSNINDLVASLRQRLHDANKNLIVLTLEILRHIPNSFEKQWERYSKMIMKEVLKVLCDNKKTVREAGVLTLHSWSEKLSLKAMQTHFTSFVSDSKTNVDGKVSILIFLTELLEGSALQFDHCLPETLTVIADCLLGKALNLRETSSSLLRNLAEAFEVEKIKDSMNSMNKHHSECIVTCLTKLGYISKATSHERRPKSALSSRPVQSRQSRPATAGAKLTPKAPKVKRAKEPEPDSFTPNDNKAERARKAPKKSLAKLEDMQRPENIRSHEMILSQYATENLCDHLFHSDFKRHCVAVEIISSLVEKAETFQGVLDNLDLILTWFSYRICEGNMQVLVKILNASGSLVTKLKEKLYKLTDYEANIIIPCLVEKCGHNNDRIRQSYKDLLIKFPHIYNPKASILMLVQGLFSKNYRTKVVCLEALEILYEQYGSDFYNTKVLKEIAVLISERDIALKNKALGLMAHIYRDIGSQCWKYLSSIPESVRKSLDLKFKSLEAPSGQSAAFSERNSNTKTPNSVQRPTSARKKLRSPILPDRDLATTPGRGTKASTALEKKAEEATLLWNRSLARASSQDTVESIEGMKQLCHILLDYAKNASGLDLTTMVNSADKLVCNLSEKVSSIFGKAIEALNSSSTRTAEVGSSRGCKYVLNTLMHSFQLTPMAASVSEPTLRKIMKNLLVLLLDEAIPSLEEGGQLLKALNVLMLKILENGNRTSTFLSLLWLLGEGACSVEQPLCSKFSDLIIKCLIKQTKHLSASIESVNLEGILAGIHTFLCGLDSGSIRNRLMEDDKPLRMVKTILHELCKLKGTDIYKYLLNIPRSPDKKQLIYTYVDLYVHTTTAARTKSSREEQSVDVKVSTPNANAKPGTKSLAEIKAELAQIFRKIGEKETSKQGLEELFFFQKSMPHIDIETHLSKTSEGFQEYIRNGLKHVSSREAAEKGKKSPLAENDKNKISPPKKKALPSIEELKQRVEKAKALLNETTC